MIVNNINNRTLVLQTAARIHAQRAGASQPELSAPPTASRQNQANAGSGVNVNISKAGRVFHAMSMRNGGQMWHNNNQAQTSPLMQLLHGSENTSGTAPIQQTTGCTTCENRAYVDQSGDGSVSFQTPTNIGPESAAALVAAHEAEHISNQREDAESDGREVVSESVRMHTAICPECKRVYVSGGQAETLTVPGEHPRLTPLNWAESMINMLLK